MKPVLRIALVVVFAGVTAHASTEVWDGGRTIPLHSLPLTDEDKVDIAPSMPHSMPFSERNTCGACHNYGTISSGWHFNSSHTNVPPGRIGEPWVWVDRYTGTQIPLSYRKWPGMIPPEKLGITPWMFTKQFARHMPGGDMAEPADPYEGVDSRWTVSGVLEINCLGCHSGSPLQDHSEWARQVGRENFRWAATAASCLGEVSGMASRIGDTWTPAIGENLDDRVWAVAPYVTYNINQFDSKGRALFDIRKPLDQRCFSCHSVTAVGAEKEDVDGDVHTRAGLRCVDCHRNGLKHDISRNYESEGRGFSCKECHETTRLGAPKPKHDGMPPIHFEKLSCTACHSGEWIGKTPTRVRTARANRLNIYGKAQWFTEAPFIEEPVMAKGDDGKLAPHRIVWPAFWARRTGDKLTPLLPAAVTNAATGILDAEQQIGKYLKALNQLTEDGEAVFVTGGKAYHVNTDGGLNGATVQTNGTFLARQKDGQLFPLVPAFDEKAEALPVEIENKILEVLRMIQSDETLPAPVVLAKGQKIYQRIEGVLTPATNAVEASTWALWRDGKLHPLVPDFVVRAVEQVTGTDYSFNEEQLAMVLKALGKDAAYVNAGKVFNLDAAGKLAVGDAKEAEPVLWPLGHDVRPAGMSLGAKSCQECHSPDSPFFHGKIVGMGPLMTTNVMTKQQYQFEELDAKYQSLFGWSFQYRPLFKRVLWATAGFIGLIVLAFLLHALRRWSRHLGGHEE